MTHCDAPKKMKCARVRAASSALTSAVSRLKTNVAHRHACALEAARTLAFYEESQSRLREQLCRLAPTDDLEILW